MTNSLKEQHKHKLHQTAILGANFGFRIFSMMDFVDKRLTCYGYDKLRANRTTNLTLVRDTLKPKTQTPKFSMIDSPLVRLGGL